jgi:hypothetical protein
MHTVADAMIVVLGFDQGDRDVVLAVEDVISALGFAAPARFNAGVMNLVQMSRSLMELLSITARSVLRYS